MSTDATPSSMLAITTTISGEGFEIMLDCETKNLFGYGEPDTEQVATDNAENVTKISFFGKSNLEPASLVCVFDAAKWKQLEDIKKQHPIVFFTVTFDCEEIGFVQSCDDVSIGQLSGANGTIAPKFNMTLIPKGGKEENLPTSTITTPDP